MYSSSSTCRICICIIVFFFFSLRAHLFVFAPLSQTSGGVGTIRPSGSRCWRFGRDPCSVSRVASLLNFFGLGHTQGKSPGFRNMPAGIGFLHPLSPRTHVNFFMQTRLFCFRRGYTFLSPFLHRAPRYDPAAQQQSSPLAAAACNCMRVWLLL